MHQYRSFPQIPLLNQLETSLYPFQTYAIPICIITLQIANATRMTLYNNEICYTRLHSIALQKISLMNTGILCKIKTVLAELKSQKAGIEVEDDASFAFKKVD